MRGRVQMKNPGSHFSLACFSIIGLLAISGTAQGEPTETPSRKSATSRAQPQVIYHLPSSNYAATLHSQDKGQNNDLPIDSSMPTSLQLSRAKANEAAAQARQEPHSSPPQEVAQPKLKSKPSQTPHRTFPKSTARGNSHGVKPPKK